jgi:hypothetical protein
MHSVYWFFITGAHDPAWVQAIANVILVLISIVSFVVLACYALDTRTLARTSVEQIALAKEIHDTATKRDLQAAWASFFRVQHNVTEFAESLTNSSFYSSPPPQLYPSDWPETTTTLTSLKPDAYQAALNFGISLMNADGALRLYYSAPNGGEKHARERKVFEAFSDVEDRSRVLLKALGYSPFSDSANASRQ